MAAITKTAPGVTSRTPTVGQYGTGAHVGQWYCKDLGGNPAADGDTPLAGWARELELAQAVQRDLSALNAGDVPPSLEAQLAATLADEVGAKRRGNRKDTK